MGTLKESISSWDYFVDWEKAKCHVREIEISLHLLDYLVGKDDIEREALELFIRYPQLNSVVPILIASRESTFSILSDLTPDSMMYERFNFGNRASLSPEKAIDFLSKSGFLNQLRTRQIKSVVDFVFGVEVGLDSNGRKNRGGQAMEKTVESFLSNICIRNGFIYEKQASAPRLKHLWDIDIPVDKSTRRIDFAVKASQSQVVLIEASFYGGGGSKLKATAGEYKELFKLLSRRHKFIWITDGLGWRTTHRPLAEAFEAIDHVINLEMVQKGVLEALILD